MSEMEESFDFELEKNSEDVQYEESESKFKDCRERPKFDFHDEELEYFRKNPNTGYYDIKRQFRVNCSATEEKSYNLFQTVVFVVCERALGIYLLAVCWLSVSLLPIGQLLGDDLYFKRLFGILTILAVLYSIFSFVFMILQWLDLYWSRKIPEFKSFMQFNDVTRRIEVLGEDGSVSRSFAYDEVIDFEVEKETPAFWKKFFVGGAHFPRGVTSTLFCVFEEGRKEAVMEEKLHYLRHKEALGIEEFLFDFWKKLDGSEHGSPLDKKKVMLDMKKIMRSKVKSL